MIDLTKIKKVHFIGIGGIGISAIARMFLLEGKKVTGSDRADSLVIGELREAGAKINLEQVAENITADINMVIYTIAISDDNPELMKAKELGIPLLTYPQVLGLVSEQKYTIAVSGTHGKTTTTAMLAKIFIDAGLDPTVVVGSLLKDLKSNFIAGKGEYFITEACEYRRSFLNLNPQAVIITNIDNDHLDYFQDLADIQSAFVELVAKVPADGYLICDIKDERLKSVIETAKCQMVDYRQTAKPEEIKLLISGEHNIKDAQAALAVALSLGVDKETILTALSHFTGTWRRFEFKGLTAKKALVYDYYAHHPTEIKATLQGAREWAGHKKIIVAFQPHLYSRTKLLLDDFAGAFSDADLVIIPDIYAAREIDDGTISSRDLVKKLKVKDREAIYEPDFAKIEKLITEKSTEGDLVITMGAGDIFKVGESLIKN